MDHTILQVRHWKTQHFFAYHTREDVPRRLKRYPGFRALRLFMSIYIYLIYIYIYFDFDFLK